MLFCREVIHWQWYKMSNFSHAKRWYMYRLESVLKIRQYSSGFCDKNESLNPGMKIYRTVVKEKQINK